MSSIKTLSRQLNTGFDLFRVAFLIFVLVTLFLAPAALLRDEADSKTDYILGFFGLLFWVAQLYWWSQFL